MGRRSILALAAACVAMFGWASLAFGVLGTQVNTAEKKTPKANPLIFDGELRLTIYCDGCMRFERGSFHDEPTLFAANRNPDFLDFEIEDKDDQVLIKTGKMIFFLNRKRFGGRMNLWDYGVHMPGIAVWHGEARVPNYLTNMGGSTATLDGKGSPFPLNNGIMTREGWFVFDETDAPIIVDGAIKVREHGMNDQDTYVLCYGKDYKAGLKALCAVSGKIPLPPRFTFGSWYSRWASYTSDDYRKIVSEYEEKGYPLDVLVWDMEWHAKGANKGLGSCGTMDWTGWSWNRKLLPDAEKLLEEMRGKGLHVALNVHPADGIRNTDFCYKEFMAALGESTEGERIIPFNAGSKEYMDAYFKYAHEPLEKAGVDVWWVDWQQDCHYRHVPGIPGLKHWPWLNKLYYEHTDKPDRRGLSLARWGGIGDQKYPIEFSGDAVCSWEMLEFEVAMTATSANEGCCYWSHDMGGFYGNRNEEMYSRWLQFGATTAAMRLHSCGDKLDRRPWLWSGEFQESLKESFLLRAKLLPYIYTGAAKLYKECLPFLRPLYYDYAADKASYVNPQEYLLGDCMLVAPIVAPGRGEHCLGSQVVYFPCDGWAQFFTGESYDKGLVAVAADLHEMPLFVRKGVPVPLGRNGLRMAALPKIMDIMVFPLDKDGSGSFTLYEDDGLTPAYKEGACANTAFGYERKGDCHIVTVGKQEGAFEGQILDRSYTVAYRNMDEPKGVTVNGENWEFKFEPESHTVTVELPEAFAGTVELEAKVADAGEIAESQLARRQALLPEDDSMGRLMACGAGVMKTSPTPYFKAEEAVWRFFPAGLFDSYRLTSKASGSVTEVKLEKGSKRPEILPNPMEGGYVLEAGGAKFEY